MPDPYMLCYGEDTVKVLGLPDPSTLPRGTILYCPLFSDGNNWQVINTSINGSMYWDAIPVEEVWVGYRTMALLLM